MLYPHCQEKPVEPFLLRAPARLRNTAESVLNSALFFRDSLSLLASYVLSFKLWNPYLFCFVIDWPSAHQRQSGNRFQVL
jgi:hypothetical protein